MVWDRGSPDPEKGAVVLVDVFDGPDHADPTRAAMNSSSHARTFSERILQASRPRFQRFPWVLPILIADELAGSEPGRALFDPDLDANDGDGRARSSVVALADKPI
jgi:hypothetical protein